MPNAQGVYDILIVALFALLGTIAASFINSYALRKAEERSNLKGRSECQSCGKTLTWYELLPIISFLIQLGKCRDCKNKISPRYLISEIIGGTATALVYVRFGLGLMTPVAFGVIIILLAIALIDLSTMEIPNGLVIALIPFAIATIWLQPEVSILSRMIGTLTISLPMFILALIITGAFGGGDIKLIAVCGFLLGWQNVLLAMFLAVLVGGAFSVYLLVAKKAEKGAKIPFAPHLCVGIAVSMLYGEEIVSLYLNLFFW